MKTIKIGNYISAILLAMLGAVMIVYPAMIMDFICYAIAAVLIVLGIVKLVTYASKDIKTAIYGHDLALGIMLIVCGVMFIIKSEVIQNLVPMIMGLIIVANGIIKLQHAINLMRFKSSSSTFVLIISLMCIAVGGVLLFVPSEVNRLITIIIGIGFLTSGVTDIVTYVIMSRKVKANELKDSPVEEEVVENPEVVEETAAAEAYEERVAAKSAETENTEG